MYSQKAEMSLHGFYFILFATSLGESAYDLTQIHMFFDSAVKSSFFESIQSQNLQKYPSMVLGGGYKHV